MPLSLVIGDGRNASGRDRFEGLANTNGAARGHELEIARLLTAIKRAFATWCGSPPTCITAPRITTI